MDTNSTALSVEQQAQFLRDASAGVYLSASVGACLGNTISPLGFKEYLDELRLSAGDSTHPLTRMLQEQFAMGHHNLGRLYSQASQSKTIDEMSAFSAVIVKMHAELRLLGETLHRLNKPGLAAAADDHTRPKSAAPSKSSGERDTQQGSKPTGDDHEPSILPFTESQPRRRRSPKSVAAARTFG